MQLFVDDLRGPLLSILVRGHVGRGNHVGGIPKKPQKLRSGG